MRVFKLLILAGVLQFATSVAFEVEQGLLRLLSQAPGLNSSYDTAIADFGTPLYGGTLVGPLVIDEGNPLTCNDIEQSTIDKWSSKHDSVNYILLTKRGECYFAEKTYRAQVAGAEAVIIYDDKDEPLLTMASPSNRSAAERASQITIPTMMIEKKAGEQLVQYLSQGGNTLMAELDWTGNLLIGSDDRVEWEFWFSTDPECGTSCDRTRDFVISFAPQAKKLLRNNITFFTPHTVFKPCFDAPDSETCKGCIKNGKYCSYETVEFKYDDPKAVAEENLRSLCVYQTVLQDNEVSRWWDYSAAVFESCTGTEFTRECSIRQLNRFYIDEAKVKKCMGDVDADEVSDIILKELGEFLDYEDTGRGKISLIPTLVVNAKEQYRGRLDSLSVLRAICAGYKQGSEPDLCLDPAVQYSDQDCSSSNDQCWNDPKEGLSACKDTFRGYTCTCPYGYQGDGKNCEKIRTEKGLSSAGVAMIVIIITIAVVGVGLGAYHYVFKQRMRHEVKSIMQQYMPLPEEMPTDNNDGQAKTSRYPN
eukprot:TRINITY_DN58696_c0_g1_i2.p1 TRINITY_DN58696_c0_g1~~TRINITY_DN58696_c0_g1_i2.p1  ORF type:complete len:533 (+),score=66.15 TRINITY_DN58696_c0_g1_i2:57-1655(+)